MVKNYCPVNHLQVDIALDEMLRLQDEGPTEQDVSTVLEIEQRAHENGLQVDLAFLCCYIHRTNNFSFPYLNFKQW